MSERTLFLHDVALDVARARFDAALLAAGVRNEAIETLPLGAALDRVTARPVIARLGLKALLAGSLANLMSAALAGIMLP